MTKICSMCKQEKSLSEFYSYKDNRTSVPKTKYHARCKECFSIKNRECYEKYKEKRLNYSRNVYDKIPARQRSKLSAAIKSKHGFGIEEYERLYAKFFDEQKGCCAICGESNTTLVLDHNHETGEYRGLLCNLCNQGIGCLQDCPEILLSAYNYILGIH